MLNKKNNYFENKVCPKNCSGDCEECQKIIDERDALAVIIEKKVDVGLFHVIFVENEEMNGGYDEYIDAYHDRVPNNAFNITEESRKPLTREEFNLLKKMYANKDQASSETKDEEQISPLDAFGEIRNYLDDILFDTRKSKALCYTSTSQYLMPFIEQVETALKDYEKKTKLAKEYADVNNVAKRLKALEIIKEKTIWSFDDYAKSITIKRKNGVMYIMLFFDKQEEYELLKEVIGCKN